MTQFRAIIKQTIVLTLCSLSLLPSIAQEKKLGQYVDPRIGSEGLGRVFIGPSSPFGMVKPSPDCTAGSNSGWLPMPSQVNGFSQLHVSGTGGGPKYGNILVMPFCEGMNRTEHIAHRTHEEISLGYYATEFKENGIRTEITTAHRASHYRFTYPKDSAMSLAIDAGFFLGENPIPDSRESQQFIGSEIQILSPYEVSGYTRIRGGWNNGKAYTVYFHAVADKPFVESATWKDYVISKALSQYDSHQKTGALLQFSSDKHITSSTDLTSRLIASGSTSITAGNHPSESTSAANVVQLKVGISFLSSLKAKQNLEEDIPHWEFNQTHEEVMQSWEELFQKMVIAESTPTTYKRMFYTGLYHTMLMPVDRSGENPLWADSEPYYDDFYAIWDTYRSSSPLITLIDPVRQRDIVRSLINIYKRDGYMPDARSGNSNGRTQGGSNAEVVVADAFVKGLQGVDYELGLEAMLKDATVPPGGNEEAEGRGGLIPYLELGYVPWGIPRAGNRTVEYAYCDYTIGLVAEGLGKQQLANHYYQQSNNWKNLWRSDYEHEGAKGFIMPRDAEGNWLDMLPHGTGALANGGVSPSIHSTAALASGVFSASSAVKGVPNGWYKYHPLSIEGPWYTPWWSMFFYEGNSWEYSLSIPHDVSGLIEMSGGAEAFEKRLDIFFDRDYFNVCNEPSFLTPCLYHWLGKPWRSTDRIHAIIATKYNDGAIGLPGNDDSGAMSSWLAFHMMGLYPNAGQDYYLINSPLLTESRLKQPHGKEFVIRTQGLSTKNCYIQQAWLNGVEYPYSVLRHHEIVSGGELLLRMGSKPSKWGTQQMFPPALPALIFGDYRDQLMGEETIYQSVQTEGDTSIGTNSEAVAIAQALYFAKATPSAITTDLTMRIPKVALENQWLPFAIKLHGQTRRFTFRFEKQADEVCLHWSVIRYLMEQAGTFRMRATSLQRATGFSFLQPEKGTHVTVPTTETAYLLSQEAFDELKHTGKLHYHHIDYLLMNPSATVGGSESFSVSSSVTDETVGLLYLKDAHTGAEMVVVDDAEWPIVWEMQGNPQGVNWIASLPVGK